MDLRMYYRLHFPDQFSSQQANRSINAILVLVSARKLLFFVWFMKCLRGNGQTMEMNALLGKNNDKKKKTEKNYHWHCNLDRQ